jgi:hypothetical protein
MEHAVKREKRRQFMPEIHVYVPAGLADSQDIHIHITQPGDDPRPDTGETVAEVLARMEASGSASPHLRAAAEDLQALGYELRAANLRKPGTKPREKYLRIMHSGYTAHGIGYLNLSNIEFTRWSDRDQLAALPGARLTDRTVVFSIANGSEQALSAAALIERQITAAGHGRS